MREKLSWLERLETEDLLNNLTKAANIIGDHSPYVGTILELLRGSIK